MANANDSGLTGQRPIPYTKIIHQPSAIYRMRYKAENRKTFLYAENYTSVATGNNTAPTPLNNSSNITTNTNESNKKTGANRKKNIPLGTTSSSASSSKIESADGVFPKIEIVNGSGPATLIVSCVNKTEPHHVHPHRLVGAQCKSGVAVINIERGQKNFELSGVSIEFTKKNDIDQSLEELKSKNVDPFNVGFNFDRNKIDLTQIRLCFQVYLRDSLESNEIIRDQYHILKPVVSNIISNSSRKSTLQILRTANMYSPASGGQNVIIFLKKLEKDQKTLSVKFFDEYGWSSIVELKDHTIHYQCAIMLNAPPYKIKDLTEDITVSLKVYVPFANENEKKDFIKQQIAEENEDLDDENPDASMQSADFFKGDPPDGKYESTKLDFKYTPNIVNTIQSKRKLDNTSLFYEFIDPVDKEAKNKISETSRNKLAKRQLEVFSDEYSIDFVNVPDMFSITNPLTLNHSIKYAEELNLASFNQDEVNPNEMVCTDEQIQMAVEAHYPKSSENLPQSQISSENINPSTSRSYDKLDGASDELVKELSSFPSFSFDPNAPEVTYDEIFSQI